MSGDSERCSQTGENILGFKAGHGLYDILDVLYNRLPDGHPKLLFKGGTSLSKAFGLIRRFSEDVDLVVYRDDLGFENVARLANTYKRRC